MPKTVDVKDAPARFTELLDIVANGSEVVLTRDDAPVARVVPIAPVAWQRLPGLHSGAVWMSDDFDAPLPEEFWTGMA